MTLDAGEQALRERRILRTVTATPLSLADVGQILWAGQGVVGARGRCCPPPASGAMEGVASSAP